MAGLWILVSICALFGASQFYATLTAKEISAPQQAAGAAMAAAWAVIPYVIARAVERAIALDVKELKRLNETLAVHTRLLAEMANASARVLK